MCGLACILSHQKDLTQRMTVLQKMLDRIYHRGPDGVGIHHVSGQGIFGHRRLAIIDLDHGAQPINSADERYTLVFNGEIYNYIEISQKLQREGVSLKTNSDSEVLLHLLIQRGTDALLELNGMYAFVFHDRHENSWIAARDHFGIKPLYFAQADGELVFASEIKSMLAHPKIAAECDQKGLKQYMCLQFCLNDQTLFTGIKKVLPGHYLTGHGADIEADVLYWSPSYQVDYDHTEEWFECQLSELLQDSISIQMRSDVPVGSYLSGGIDSSLVSSLASRHLGTPMKMFHGRFAEGPEYDESEYAKALVDYANGIYHETVPTASEFVRLLPELIYSLDEPLAGPGVFPQFCTSRLASKHVKVILGGQGGDEIFGGYARYLVGYLEQALKGAIMGTQEEGNHLVTLESIVPNLSILKQYVPLLSSFWQKNLFQDMDARYFKLIDRSEGLDGLLHDDFKNTYDTAELFCDFQSIFNGPDTGSYINKMTNFDQQTLLPALLQIEDRVSMSSSIESRVPLLDRRIADLVATMPPPMKFQGGKTKHILKKSIEKFIPEKILNRQDKMGFPVPLKEWMEGGEVRDFVSDTLLSKKSVERGIYNKKALDSMLQKHGVGARQLWGALSLELWHQRFIDAN